MQRERCKKCGYDLRGLPNSASAVRCPECGSVQSGPQPLTRDAFFKVETQALAVGLIPMAVEFFLTFWSEGWTRVGILYVVVPILGVLACLSTGIFRARKLKKLGYSAPSSLLIWGTVCVLLQMVIAIVVFYAANGLALTTYKG